MAHLTSGQQRSARRHPEQARLLGVRRDGLDLVVRAVGTDAVASQRRVERGVLEVLASTSGRSAAGTRLWSTATGDAVELPEPPQRQHLGARVRCRGPRPRPARPGAAGSAGRRRPRCSPRLRAISVNDCSTPGSSETGRSRGAPVLAADEPAATGLRVHDAALLEVRERHPEGHPADAVPPATASASLGSRSPPRELPLRCRRAAGRSPAPTAARRASVGTRCGVMAADRIQV